MQEWTQPFHRGYVVGESPHDTTTADSEMLPAASCFDMQLRDFQQVVYREVVRMENDQSKQQDSAQLNSVSHDSRFARDQQVS